MTTQIVDGARPKHEQLRAILERMCADDLAPGDPLPSERRLCELYGVSRITVREAIGQLVSEGLLVRVHGKGTFVAARQVRSQLHLASFHQDMRKLGLTPTTAVLLAREEPLPAASAELLGVDEGEPGWHVHRLRIAGGLPMATDESWFVAARLPGLVGHDLSQSLYELLDREYGIVLDGAEQTVGAVPAGQTLATLLGIEPGRPVLEFNRVSSFEGAPVEHTVSYYRGDRYQLQMSLQNS